MGVQKRGSGRAIATRWRARLCLPLLVVALGLASAAPAQATLHLIKVREVYAGANDDSYVELQMYAAGQSFLAGHSMTVYNADGALTHSSTFSASVANAANQQTVLIGDTKVGESFGVAPDLVDGGLAISAAGGAACWNAGGIPADCVAWGNFSGGAALQVATGTSVGAAASPAGIAAGKAIRRTIEPGCPTLLEESDDSDNSATDFTAVTPAPRNDASPISEHTCTGAPNTAIDERPPLRSNSTSAEFTYEAPTATGYECRLDAAAFSSCPFGGPKEYSGLSDGSHTFQVRGLNASGPDPTPASYTWTVDTVPPIATIDTHPADPSPGASAQFTYHAPEEPGSSFQCSLDGAPFSSCPASGIAYSGLNDGPHSFQVRATDPSDNTDQTPAGYSFEVALPLQQQASQASLPPPSPTFPPAKTRPTAPETAFAGKPAVKTHDRTPTFRFRSPTRGASFQCRLDRGPYRPCRSPFTPIRPLELGRHTLKVRALLAGSIDATPAVVSFKVVGR